MPNKFSAGCQCCGDADNVGQSAGLATVIWRAPPCPQNNRIGINVTIENLIDCTDAGPFCGSCTRTFSNINGTYFLPVSEDDLSTPFLAEQVYGPWYTGSASCTAATCFEAAAYPYIKISFKVECDTINGLQVGSGFYVQVFLCQEDGTDLGNRTCDLADTAGTWSSAVPRPFPDCCNSFPCDNSSVNSQSGASPAPRYKFDYVTAS